MNVLRRLREWSRRLVGSLFRRRRDADLEEELRAHLELAADDAQRRGLDRASAARAARVTAGGTAQAMEALRDQRGLPWLDDLERDVTHAARMLRRSPGFTSVAITTLALGIGANTSIFTIMQAVILRPLEYSNPDRLFRVTAEFSADGSSATGLSYPELLEFRDVTQSFADVGMFAAGGSTTGGGGGVWAGEVNLSAADRPLRVRAAGVDDRLLRVLGVRTLQGRLFNDGETDAMPARPGLGGPAVAILSEHLWTSAFGGRPIVGEMVNIDGRPHEIVGVMAAGADLVDRQPEVWLPIGVNPVFRQIRTNHFLGVVGRLRDGVTPQAAEAELSTLLENWSARTGAKGHVPVARPARTEDHRLQLQPLQDSVVGDARHAVWVLQAAVGFVLLIGCANLASLSLARAEARRREFAVRIALGATRGRLLRQAMTEGLLLSIGGGVLGLWLAQAGLQALLSVYPASLPRLREVTIDVPVLLFTLGISIGTGLLFGLAPVTRRRASDLLAAASEGGERSSSGVRRRQVRQGLVIAEVALAVLLVTTAALLGRSVVNLTRVDAGFDRSMLLTFSMTLPRGVDYPRGRAEIYQQLLATIRTAPGIDAATAMSDLPLTRFTQRYPTRVQSDSDPKVQTSEVVDHYQFVMSDYFETMRIPIVAGRDFNAADAASTDRVVLVNETLALKLWKGRNAIGQRVRPNLSASLGTGANPWHTVVGVVGDVKENGVDREAGTEIYLFIDQPAPSLESLDGPWSPQVPVMMHVALRTRLTATALTPLLEAAVRRVDPAVPIVRLRNMDTVLAHSIRRPRLLSQLLTGFAALALLLAVIGTYGLLAHAVTERRREIGVRVALGATRSDVLAFVLRDGLRSVGLGLIVGMGAVFAVSRVIGSLLFGIPPTDLPTIALVGGTLLLVALGAAVVPAWRAARVDPVGVLRAD
jgi:putative ABC transport system permease protein